METPYTHTEDVQGHALGRRSHWVWRPVWRSLSCLQNPTALSRGVLVELMINARFEVLTAEPMKILVFWNFTQCRLVNSYRPTRRNIPRDLNLSVNQGIPRLTPNPKICNVSVTWLHFQSAEFHHTSTHNTQIVTSFVSVGSEAMTLLHSHTLSRRMRGGKDDDDDVEDNHMIQITEQFLRYLNNSSLNFRDYIMSNEMKGKFFGWIIINCSGEIPEDGLSFDYTEDTVTMFFAHFEYNH